MAPKTLLSLLTLKSVNPTLANKPSAVPINKSEFGSILMQFTPCGNSLLTGPILLYMQFFKSISKISPLLVPQ